MCLPYAGDANELPIHRSPIDGRIYMEEEKLKERFNLLDGSIDQHTCVWRHN